ncbi:hypothetical protein RclHR1_16080001 [Rhizophagus clarus]|nr:hypothetical protein RclHR1_16080001 [Rhizophagus clarus]
MMMKMITKKLWIWKIIKNNEKNEWNVSEDSDNEEEFDNDKEEPEEKELEEKEPEKKEDTICKIFSSFC